MLVIGNLLKYCVQNVISMERCFVKILQKLYGVVFLTHIWYIHRQQTQWLSAVVIIK